MEADEEQYATLDNVKDNPIELVQRMMDGDHKSLGNAVTDAVLLCWKTDSGKYKVIFGDLSSVEMNYEDLIKIEPQTEPNSVPSGL